MRYNSPGRKVRLEWTKVTGPRAQYQANFAVLNSEVHEWCTGHGSDNRFYKHYASDSFWFELESDAILFQLRWAGATA